MPRSPRHWRQVKRLFGGALARPPTEREPWIAAAAAPAPVRAEVLRLLASLEHAGDFLEGNWLGHGAPAAGGVLANTVSHRLAAGDRLSRYEIVDLLGIGGMGEVYRAHDTRLARVVVLKVLPADLAADPEWRARLEREARAVSSLNHPHVCALYDIGRENDVDFLVMEYLAGETLAAHLDRGALPLDDVLTCALQICGALDIAHRHGIVHRDLKPANIMLTAGGAKLLDFGIAKPAGEAIVAATEEAAAPGRASPLTQPDGRLGTAAYMAPEQIRGEAVDARTDIFAFGAVLYEMLTACKAFSGVDRADVFDAILNRERPAVRPRRRDVPRGVERVVRKCLAKDAADRYQSAAELARDLKSTAAASRRRLVTRLMTAAALVATIAAGVVSMRREQPPPPIAPAMALAVVPFANTSGDAAQDYLTDGLTDELITELARLQPDRLRVLGRSTVVRYYQTHSDGSQLGRDLGVDYVIEGSAALRGPRVQLSVRLARAGDRSMVWEERYERPVNELLIVRADMARSIAAAVALALTPEQQARLDTMPPIDPEAYEHYLKGRFFSDKRTEKGLQRGIEEFGAATKIYPRYAAAYAGMSSSYLLLAYYAYAPPNQAFALARAASTKALEFDDHLPEAHVSLAGIYNDYDHRWADADREYQAALRLDPNHPTAHQWYANHLIAMGRHDDAHAHILKARALDPLSLIIQVNVANIFLLSRQYERAIAECRKALEMDDEYVTARWVLGRAEELRGAYPAATAEFRRALELEPGSTRLQAALARTYALAGDATQARALLQALIGAAPAQHVSALDLASVQASLGDLDAAFLSLERAARDHANLVSYLNVDPGYDAFRRDRRFGHILGLLGLD